MPVQWKLRYRSPVSPTGQSTAALVHEVIIETDNDDEAVANELAAYYLQTHASHPNTRMIPPLQRNVMLTERQWRAALKKSLVAESAESEDHPTKAASAPRAPRGKATPAVEPAARIGQ